MRALGMPLAVYREHFGQANIKTRIRSQTAPLSVSTSFYVECEIAKSLGMTHEQYRQQTSRKERILQLLFRILSNAKEVHSYEESKAKAERDAQFNQNAQGIDSRLRG